MGVIVTVQGVMESCSTQRDASTGCRDRVLQRQSC